MRQLKSLSRKYGRALPELIEYRTRFRLPWPSYRRWPVYREPGSGVFEKRQARLERMCRTHPLRQAGRSRFRIPSGVGIKNTWLWTGCSSKLTSVLSPPATPWGRMAFKSCSAPSGGNHTTFGETGSGEGNEAAFLLALKSLLLPG